MHKLLDFVGPQMHALLAFRAHSDTRAQAEVDVQVGAAEKLGGSLSLPGLLIRECSSVTRKLHSFRDDMNHMGMCQNSTTKGQMALVHVSTYWGSIRGTYFGPTTIPINRQPAHQTIKTAEA